MIEYHGEEVIQEIRKPGEVMVAALLARGADPQEVKVVKSDLLEALKAVDVGTLWAVREPGSNVLYVDIGG